MHYGRAIGAGILAGLLAACSSQNSNSTGPIPYGGTSPTAVSTVNTLAVGNTANSSPAASVPQSTETGGSFIASTSATTVPRHVLTGDYLGAPNGSSTLTPAQVAPYLNWAQVAYTAANATSAAGIKVQAYFNPNHVATYDPLYAMLPSSGWAETCSSARVHLDYKARTTEYQTNPESSALRSIYASYVASRLRGEHVDAVFEDTAGPLQGSGIATFLPSLPCNYNTNAWLDGERSLEAGLSVPTIFNGLSGLDGHNVSLSIGLLENAKTIGGAYEHCFADTASEPVLAAWVWTAAENTQLSVTHQGKLFQCMAFDTASASTQIATRIYTIASFLMTYDINHSVLQELFATPSRFHVLPESELVPTNPAIANPSNISSLLAPGGAYVREYRSCYIAQRLAGACAMVVNPSYNTVPYPATLSAFHHTLTLAGYSVLEGGTIGTKGAVPPRTLAKESAVVVFP